MLLSAVTRTTLSGISVDACNSCYGIASFLFSYCRNGTSFCAAIEFICIIPTKSRCSSVPLVVQMQMVGNHILSVPDLAGERKPFTLYDVSEQRASVHSACFFLMIKKKMNPCHCNERILSAIYVVAEFYKHCQRTRNKAINSTVHCCFEGVKNHV